VIPIQNCFEQGDALLPLLFKVAVQHTIGKVGKKKNQKIL
jgi:hypothetical protein